MKKALISLLAIYSINCYADTETINWYIDGNVYNTTQCESGGDVSLPPTPPERLGYTFTGWQEVFNRGTFASWAAIPNVATGYLSDSYGSYTPKENDYIIVSDASDVPSYENKIKIEVQSSAANIWNYCRTYIDSTNYGCPLNTQMFNGSLIIYRGNNPAGSRVRYTWQSNNKDIEYNGLIYKTGSSSIQLDLDPGYSGTYYAKFINGYPYSGTWRLRYVGNWADYKRGGWIPEKRLD